MKNSCIGNDYPSRILVAAVLAAGSLLASPARAQATFDVTVLAGACANCHGTDGRSPGGIPSLAGRPEAVLKAQMLAYKSDAAPVGTTIMNRLAKGYSDEEISALAHYFSTITPRLAAAQKEVGSCPTRPC